MNSSRNTQRKKKEENEGEGMKEGWREDEGYCLKLCL